MYISWRRSAPCPRKLAAAAPHSEWRNFAERACIEGGAADPAFAAEVQLLLHLLLQPFATADRGWICAAGAIEVVLAIATQQPHHRNPSLHLQRRCCPTCC